MKVIKTITKEVSNCMECPHSNKTMDGLECELLAFPTSLVLPEGRTKINRYCPLKLTNKKSLTSNLKRKMNKIHE